MPHSSPRSFRHTKAKGIFIYGKPHLVLTSHIRYLLIQRVESAIGMRSAPARLQGFLNSQRRLVKLADEVRNPEESPKSLCVKLAVVTQYDLVERATDPVAQITWLDTAYQLNLIDEAAPFDGSDEEKRRFVLKWEAPLAEAKARARLTVARRRYKKLVDMV